MQHDEQATAKVAFDPLVNVADPRSRRWVLVFGVVAIALLVIMAVPPLSDAIKPIDDWFWRLAVDNEYPILVTSSEVVAEATGPMAKLILTIIGAVLLAWRRRWTALALWLSVIALATVVNAAIKIAYDRPRPPMGLAEHFTGSFTSGHAFTAAVVALLIVLVWVPDGPRRQGMLVVGLIYALAVAASRVYLRVHWFSDVVAGLAVGAATGFMLVLLARWWMTRSAG